MRKHRQTSTAATRNPVLGEAFNLQIGLKIIFNGAKKPWTRGPTPKSGGIPFLCSARRRRSRLPNDERGARQSERRHARRIPDCAGSLGPAAAGLSASSFVFLLVARASLTRWSLHHALIGVASSPAGAELPRPAPYPHLEIFLLGPRRYSPVESIE